MAKKFIIAKKLATCHNCQKEVTYHLETCMDIAELEGRQVQYTRIKAICNNCGKEVWVAVVDDMNAKNASRALYPSKK